MAVFGQSEAIRVEYTRGGHLSGKMNEDKQTSLKFIGYARKSSEDNKERQAASLPEQIYALEGMRVKDKLDVIEILQESRSAHTPGRPLFDELLARIRDGKADGIVVWHENRLSRNAYDAGQIIYLMDEGKLVEIRTAARTYHNTPGDKFMLQIELASSKKDSDDKSIVVSRGLEGKARKGWRPGVAPQGYLNDKATESGFRRILVDPERLPFIKKIFEMFDSGVAVVDIHKIAKEEWKFRTRQKKRSGGGFLSISMIYSILTNPFYTGRFEYPVGSGKWYEGDYEPAVSQDVFDKIQIKLGRKSQYKLKNHEFAYSGSLIHCHSCGSAIVMEEKWQCMCGSCKKKFSITKNNRDKCSHCGVMISNMNSPKILHYIYARCGKKLNPKCTERSVRIDRLEQQINDKLLKIDIAPSFMEWAIKQILKDNEQEKNFREATVENIKRSHDQTRARLDNLLQLKISPANSDGSLLSDEAYKQQKVELENELKGIEKQLGDVDNRMIQANDQTEKAFTFAARAQERFNTTKDLKVKRDIFMGLGLNLKLHDRKVLFDAPKYILEIEKMKNEAPIIAERVEPKKEPVNMALLGEKFSSIPTVLRGLELRQVCEIMSLKCTLHYPAYI